MADYKLKLFQVDFDLWLEYRTKSKRKPRNYKKYCCGKKRFLHYFYGINARWCGHKPFQRFILKRKHPTDDLPF